jgi:hypothetical protein
MTQFNSTILIIFAVIAYMMVVDNNVSTYIVLQTKLIKINIERFFWMLVHHPSNFITTWINNRKYDRIAKELFEEFNSKGGD